MRNYIMEKSARKSYIDIAKGIGILLVILGHIIPNGNIKIAIYSFHMPLFFIVAGMVLKPESFDVSIKKRWNNIAVPYLLWALIFSRVTFEKLALILYGSNESLTLAGSNAMLWFLSSMFFATLVAKAIILWVKEREHGLFVIALSMIALLILSWICSLFHNKVEVNGFVIGLPLGIDVTLLAASFMIFGRILNLMKSKIQFNSLEKLIIAVVLVTISFIGNLREWDNGYPSMAIYNVGVPSVYFLIACISSVGIIFIAEAIGKCWNAVLLCWLGRNALLIFILHRTLLYVFKEYLENQAGSFVLYIVVWVALSIYSAVGSMIISKLIPILAGRTK